MFPKLNGLCKFLDWDSEHFNKRIAQVTSSFLDQDDFKIVDHWCITNNIDCVYYLKDLSNFSTFTFTDLSLLTLSTTPS